MESDLLQEEERRQSRILDADYSAVDTNDFVNELDYLSTEQQSKLVDLLDEYPDLFKGGLGTLNIKPIHIELIKDVKPYHASAFPVPKSMEATTKTEIECLTKIGIV